MELVNTWYTVKQANEPISQGDIFFNCPLFFVKPDINFDDPTWTDKVEYDIYEADVVVVTQACDLERNPVDTVLLVRIDDANEIQLPEPTKESPIVTRRSYMKSIYAGSKPNLHLIGNHPGPELEMNYQVVDFSSVFTLPYETLKRYQEKHGPRLRLNIPHREYLSQRFGNFYSRIGLPNEDHIRQSDMLAKINNDKIEYKKEK